MDAVAPGLGADIDHRITDARRLGIEDAVGARDAHRHGVDQDVAIVGRIEIGLAADRRHADRIAVAADARHHAGHQMPCLRMAGIAEAQRVHVGDGPGTHGEHVAQDAADTGRSALIGFDEGGVVVALDLEDRRLPVADIDHAGILARPLDNARPLGRQRLQPDSRGFVGAMLAPHHREDAKLGDARFAAHDLQDAVIFLGRQPVFGDDLGGDGDVPPAGLGCGHARWVPMKQCEEIRIARARCRRTGRARRCRPGSPRRRPRDAASGPALSWSR